VVMDIYPTPEEVTNQSAVAFGGLLEEEARMARFQFLSQVLTTRSDIFTAYVYIRGYPAGDFSQPPIEAARFVAIFDRSNVRIAGDMPRLVGYFRVE